ncbi:disease resistance RPP13-like protein 4 [Pyrus communis]|uniref:disease resistance RPP13-like protein 4 n=1 Tax=Pyrus communis TaxID=23211 RepID=UPI0035BFF71F
MSTRELFTTSFQSPYVSLDLLSYVKSGQVTPFQIFNEVIMPDFHYHISKDKQFLTEYDEKHKSSSSTNSEEDDSSRYLQTLQKIQSVQSDLIYIGKACSRLKQWEDLVNDAIRELVLQSLDDAFKERTETLENSTKTNFLHNKLDKVVKIISSLKESLQLPSVNFDSESFRLSMTRAEFNLHHSLAELQDLNLQNMTEGSSAFKDTEEAYDRLRDPQKGCFLCFSVFPENAVIKKKVLVHWWVGEGFIDTSGAEGKTAEETANEFFKEFTEKGLIKPEYKKRRPSADSCTMDPATRYAVIVLAKRDLFFNFDADGNPTEDFTCSRRACLVKTDEGSSILELPFHLKQENVRSMINVNEPDLEFRPDWFSKMKNVRVLQLGRWQSSAEHLIQVEDSDFLKGLKNMRHLRYLSLRGVSGITELPAAVCKLSNLRILNLNGCLDLEKIPRGIGSLKNLTHLDMYECYLMSHMPKGLALLSNLQVLKGFVIDEPRPAGGGRQPCKLADLSSLQHLRKLSIHVDINKMSDDVERELISLADFKKLRSLSISWSRLYDHIKRPPLRRRLTNKLSNLSKLKSRKSSFSSTPPVSPSKASDSPSLRVLLEKLNLHYFPYSKIPDWLMQWELDKLKKLHIRGGRLSDLCHGNQCQWNVKVLRLKFLERLQMSWPRLQELFPELNYLEIFECPKLSSMPCDNEGVWVKGGSKQEEASNSNHQ